MHDDSVKDPLWRLRSRGFGPPKDGVYPLEDYDHDGNLISNDLPEWFETREDIYSSTDWPVSMKPTDGSDQVKKGDKP